MACVGSSHFFLVPFLYHAYKATMRKQIHLRTGSGSSPGSVPFLPNASAMEEFPLELSQPLDQGATISPPQGFQGSFRRTSKHPFNMDAHPLLGRDWST